MYTAFFGYSVWWMCMKKMYLWENNYSLLIWRCWSWLILIFIPISPDCWVGGGVPGPPCFGSKEKLQRGCVLLLAQEKCQAEALAWSDPRWLLKASGATSTSIHSLEQSGLLNYSAEAQKQPDCYCYFVLISILKFPRKRWDSSSCFINSF